MSSSPPHLDLNGVKVPGFFYGTAWKEDRTQALTTQAIKAGFRAIDTANQRRHYVETGVGEAVAAALADGVKREELFLQTKFTYVNGQDHRLPYDPEADLPTQVRQSFASSLEHLKTDYVDSYVLHGPAYMRGWSTADVEVWETMAELKEAGKARLIGVSNVSVAHLAALCEQGPLPSFVQNRCFARMGWDRGVRALCDEHGIRYQGFSLLTANPEVWQHPYVADIAKMWQATPAQVIFRFSLQVGMIPLTGTSNSERMVEDLDCARYTLTDTEVAKIESLVA
jgi:diketogulonate reductase-like aldo/keto reductase